MLPGGNLLNEESPLLSGTQDGLRSNTIYIYLVACMSAIGGFLFGYDTGIISGVMIFIKDVFDLNEWWQEAIVSSTLLAAWIFSIFSGMATDRLGRKPVILISSFIFIAGSVIMALAHHETTLLLGRLVVGAGVGLASMTTPMYIAEVAPSGIRGQLVMINMCCITAGQFFASVIAYWFSFIENGHGWRYMLGFAAIPAGIQLFGFMLMPESPRWLINNKRYEQAKKVLTRIRPEGADVEAEFEEIKRNCVEAVREMELLSDPGQSTLDRIMASQPVRKALFVGCLLQVIQQVSGINTVMYYSASIFEMSGVHSKQKALLLSGASAFVNFVMTLVGFCLVEKAGRRKLTLVSLFGVVVSLCTLAIGFQVAYHNSPRVTNPIEQELKLDGIDSTALIGIENLGCSGYSQCSSCTRDPQCGFCFSPNTALASCLHVNLTHHDRSLIGNCSSGSTDQIIWAYEWCPSSYSWLTLVGMIMYLFFFAPGMGPMPWTINSEIYPSWARSRCLSIATSFNWLFNLIVSMTFLSLTRAITKQGAFYLYAFLAAIGFIYFAIVLPETRGRTLEDLEGLFASENYILRRKSSVSNASIPSDKNKAKLKV